MLRSNSKSVVIKVQHKNIDIIMKRDLLNLERIVRLEHLLFGPKEDSCHFVADWWRISSQTSTSAQVCEHISSLNVIIFTFHCSR